MHVPAHAIAPEELQRALDGAQEFSAIILGKKSFKTFDVSGLHADFVRAAMARARLTPGADETRLAWTRAARCGAATFLLARGPAGARLPVPIDERLLVAPADPTTATPGVWESAACAAIASGDPLARWLLLTSPPQNTPGVVSAPWCAPFAEALPKLLTGDPTASQALLRAVDATDPDALPEPLRTVALDLAAPGLEALYRAFADPAGFEGALVKALEHHREHWAGRAARHEGWVPLLPLAAARLARERGVRFEVTSEYLPPALLDAPATAALGCPYCLAPIDAAWPSCPSCLETLGNDAPFELEPGELDRVERRPCTACARRIPQLAVRCPTCRTRQ